MLRGAQRSTKPSLLTNYNIMLYICHAIKREWIKITYRKKFGTCAVKLDLVCSHNMQGLKLSAEWKECNYFKFWKRQEYFRLIILNYCRNLAKLVFVGVLIYFWQTYRRVFIPAFWDILLSPTNYLICHTPQHQSTDGWTAIKRCTNPTVVAVQFAK